MRCNKKQHSATGGVVGIGWASGNTQQNHRHEILALGAIRSNIKAFGWRVVGWPSGNRGWEDSTESLSLVSHRSLNCKGLATFNVGKGFQ